MILLDPRRSGRIREQALENPRGAIHGQPTRLRRAGLFVRLTQLLQPFLPASNHRYQYNAFRAPIYSLFIVRAGASLKDDELFQWGARPL